MKRSVLILGALIFLAACSSSTVSSTAPTSAPTISAALSADDLAILNTPFIDAFTGNSIKLGDFAGKTIYVEAMAAWCTNCRIQQHEIITAQKSFDSSTIFLSIDLDPNENAAQLAQYSKDQGYEWRFAIAGGTLADKLINKFGRTITNPPSTPKFTISPSGKISDLGTGIESSDDLIKRIKVASAA